MQSQIGKAALAAVAAQALPLISALWVFLQGAPNEDDDPFRAAGVLLLISPIFILLMALYYLATPYFLGLLSQPANRSNLLLMNAVVALAVGVRAAAGSSGEDRPFNIAAALGLLVVLSIGSLVWVYLGEKSLHNKRMQTDEP